ncbi:Ankyrin repeat-containing protein [Artemisia annua]|uniref:Ankyrin repeat-containing protein n=1 Tax=Artemisia annua TaxID=35608 RepID=A0A2U1MCR7_ARTAN|nr:Ankyrin repeat-containing protein [Artemisia annua]
MHGKHVQMSCLLTSHNMFGYIKDFTAKDVWDELQCIYGREIFQQASDFTAKDVWDELQCIYGREIFQQASVSTQLVELNNSDGSTLLHVAAIVDNTKAVNILVARDRDFLITKENKDQIPLAIALSNMHTETLGVCLITSIQEQRRILCLLVQMVISFGDNPLVLAISSKEFVKCRLLASMPSEN